MTRPADTLPESEAGLRTETTTGAVGYRLRRAQLSVFQKFLAFFDEFKLRPAEFSVLVLISDNPGRKQTEIAQVLGIKRANFVTLVHGLEQRGLVERVPSDHDRRANALHLTPAGTAFLGTAQSRHAELEDEIAARLGGPAARDQLLALLDQLI
ncbi:MarR family winged helix-turn-helix transcriptional regulator [Devosia sediminis]|uniref:MarR family transcriptional regulator n=1 Tax=Devosia sediminis TaxID=2798801 RepID=A0A934IVY5_9HYPH|nr:MarR family transcriptional regulator [Devosia sediminis]MBJ3786096.1 MarR family transcriptional regulator [Devosia sediminis]